MIDYNEVKTPADLQQFMCDNIQYGYTGYNGRKYLYGTEDWDKDWYDNYVVQSGDGVLKTLCGNCWDQVELERKWFKENDYEFKTFFVRFRVKEPNDYPTHAFLAFHKNNKWYWFENSYFCYRGIHEYDILDVLVNDVVSKHFKATMNVGATKPSDIDLIEYHEFTEPKPGISVDGYINHAIGRK